MTEKHEGHVEAAEHHRPPKQLGPKREIGSQLMRAREKAEMTRATLSTILQIGVSRIRSIENGRGELDLGDLLRFAWVVGLDVKVCFFPHKERPRKKK